MTLFAEHRKKGNKNYKNCSQGWTLQSLLFSLYLIYLFLFFFFILLYRDFGGEKKDESL